MIGIEINYLVKGECVDSEGPFFTVADANLSDLTKWFHESDDNSIEVTTNEYWGDRMGYEFNDCFKRKEYHCINSLMHDLT